jgi:hypothetical protein
LYGFVIWSVLSGPWGWWVIGRARLGNIWNWLPTPTVNVLLENQQCLPKAEYYDSPFLQDFFDVLVGPT